MECNSIINNEAIQGGVPIPLLINNPICKGDKAMTKESITQMFSAGNLKDIPGYEGLYAASKDGRVWSYPKPYSSKDGLWMKPSGAEIKFEKAL